MAIDRQHKNVCDPGHLGIPSILLRVGTGMSRQRYIHCTQVHHGVISGGILIMTAICIVFVVKWTQPKHAGIISCRCSAHACPSRLSRGQPSKARLARGTQMVRQSMMNHLRASGLAKKRSCMRTRPALYGSEKHRFPSTIERANTFCVMFVLAESVDWLGCPKP